MTDHPSRDVSVAVLGTGSKGNCTYIGDGRQGVLIDCGLSARQIFLRLEAVGLGGAPIDAVFITHEHSDHVVGARVLDKRLFKETGVRTPFYMTAGTASALSERVKPVRIEPIVAGVYLSLGDWTIEPFTIPHDVADPVGYAIETGGLRIGVVTDLGKVTSLVEQKLSTLDVAVLEFNHDIEMLLEGPYPWPLKQRIRGTHGHLSNDQAAEVLHRVAAAGRLSHVVLAHLSDENNAPSKAYRAAQRSLATAGRGDVEVHVGNQTEPCLVVPCRAAPEASTEPDGEQQPLFGGA